MHGPPCQNGFSFPLFLKLLEKKENYDLTFESPCEISRENKNLEIERENKMRDDDVKSQQELIL